MDKIVGGDIGMLFNEELQIFNDNGGDRSKLKLRTCLICDELKNCYNGWCAKCLEQFKSINGRWPCQKS